MVPPRRVPCAGQQVGRSRGLSYGETPFLLEDGSGICIVEPVGAKPVGAARDVWYYWYNHWSRVDRGHGPPPWWMRLPLWRYRHEEDRLMPGPAGITGWLSTEAPGAAASRLIRDWRRESFEFERAFDRDNNRRVEGLEWADVKAHAHRVIAAVQAKQGADRPIRFLGRIPPDESGEFLLSGAPIDDLIARYRKWALWGLAAAVIAGLLLAAGT